jgi:hypothetical protein
MLFVMHLLIFVCTLTTGVAASIHRKAAATGQSG